VLYCCWARNTTFGAQPLKSVEVALDDVCSRQTLATIGPEGHGADRLDSSIVLIPGSECQV